MQFGPRCIDGQPYGLNMGLVGVGSNNSRGQYDNVTVQVLPPQTSLENTEDFADGIADLFTGESAGTWTVSGGRDDRHVDLDRAGDEHHEPAGARAPATRRSTSTR